MARLNASLAAVLVVVGASCAVQKQDENNDSFHMKVDGNVVDFEFVDKLAQEVSAQNFDEIDAVYGYDDRDAHNYDAANALGLSAARLLDSETSNVPKFSFHFSTPADVEPGDAVVNRSFLFRAHEPFFQWIDKSGAEKVRYSPRNGSNIHFDIGDDNRMTLTFDTIEMVDTCDNVLTLSDGEIDAALLSTDVVSDGPMHLVEESGQPAQQFEGTASIATDKGPFNDLIPLAFAPDAQNPSTDVILTNLCPTGGLSGFTVSFADNQHAPGAYDVNDLFVDGVVEAGDPNDPGDDDIFFAFAGEVTVVDFSSEFVTFDITQPIDLVHVVTDAQGQLQLDDARHIAVSGGHVRSFITAE